MLPNHQLSACRTRSWSLCYQTISFLTWRTRSWSFVIMWLMNVNHIHNHLSGQHVSIRVIGVNHTTWESDFLNRLSAQLVSHIRVFELSLLGMVCNLPLSTCVTPSVNRCAMQMIYPFSIRDLWITRHHVSTFPVANPRLRLNANFV